MFSCSAAWCNILCSVLHSACAHTHNEHTKKTCMPVFSHLLHALTDACEPRCSISPPYSKYSHSFFCLCSKRAAHWHALISFYFILVFFSYSSLYYENQTLFGTMTDTHIDMNRSPIKSNLIAILAWQSVTFDRLFRGPCYLQIKVTPRRLEGKMYSESWPAFVNRRSRANGARSLQWHTLSALTNRVLVVSRVNLTTNAHSAWLSFYLYK